MKTKSKTIKKLAPLGIAISLAIGSVGATAFAAPAANSIPVAYEITSPYANVDWATTGQYKAAHHTHTTFSDGSNTRRDMLLDKYAKGFDIVAITDHDNTTGAWNAPVLEYSWDNNWNNIGRQYASDFDVWAFANGIGAGWASSPGTYAGVRGQSNGMIAMGYSNEISANGGFRNADGSSVYGGHHINSFFADVPGNIGTDGNGRTMQQVIEAVANAGGITHLNHPGRYTQAMNNADISRDPVHVDRYASLFMDYPSLVGLEIINKWDGESVNDRILWDSILTQTMPQGRFVWGFSNDDSHSLSGNGHAWNTMLMPALTEGEVRISMETGAFYGVSRVDRHHGIN
ncbi:MAG: hypothetical protein FWE82_07580, partial [Defluviitaleaceae bacterium]|nr:hypothetical protein [Defluviitaleaceae bacterium]